MAIPFRIRRAEWVAGIFVVLVVLVALGGLLALARSSGTFEGRAGYQVVMSQGYGIAPGGRVNILGIDVGRIETVEITSDNRIRAKLSVQGEYADRIRTDSVARVQASIGLEGVLAGVGFEIAPGSPDANVLPPGSELTAAEPDQLADLVPGVEGDPMFDDLQEIVHNTRLLTDELTDPGSGLRSLVTDAGKMMGTVNAGNSSVARVLNDDGELYDRVIRALDRFEGAVDRFDKTMAHSDKVLDRSDEVLARSNEVMGRADKMFATADAAVGRMGPVMDSADGAMKSLNTAVVAFTKSAAELSELIGQMDAVVVEMAEVTRATKRVFPIRRHLDKKPNSQLIDAPAR